MARYGTHPQNKHTKTRRQAGHPPGRPRVLWFQTSKKKRKTGIIDYGRGSLSQRQQLVQPTTELTQQTSTTTTTAYTMTGAPTGSRSRSNPVARWWTHLEPPSFPLRPTTVPQCQPPLEANSRTRYTTTYRASNPFPLLGDVLVCSGENLACSVSAF